MFGLFKRNKKDANTSNDSDLTPPKHTSTPPPGQDSHDTSAKDVSSDVPRDTTFNQSAYSGDSAAAANLANEEAAEPGRERFDENDPRIRFRGPPPETIPVPMPAMDMGSAVPQTHTTPTATVNPPVLEDTSAPKTVPYTYTSGKRTVSGTVRKTFDKILVDRRSPFVQQGKTMNTLEEARG